MREKGNLKPQRTLVTGGSGFIGSSLVRSLLKEGHDVVVFDNNYRGHENRLSSIRGDITFIEGDICDFDQVLDAVSGCQNIFHLAFINGTRFFYEQPKLVLDVGLRGGLNIINAALREKIETFALASSSEVYQEPTLLPTPEDERTTIPNVLNPRYSYAGAKLISELLAINYFRESRIRHLIFRPHNVFGPDMGLEHVIPELMRKLYVSTNGWKKSSCEITILGTGKESRAFCYVEDAVEQLKIIFLKGESGNIYNVGMDSERSIDQLVVDIASILGIEIQVSTKSGRVGSANRRCPSIRKLKSIGYKKKDNYHKGLERTLLWYKSLYSSSNLLEKPVST